MFFIRVNHVKGQKKRPKKNMHTHALQRGGATDLLSCSKPRSLRVSLAEQSQSGLQKIPQLLPPTPLKHAVGDFSNLHRGWVDLQKH